MDRWISTAEVQGFGGDDRGDQTDGTEDMNLAMWCKNKYCEVHRVNTTIFHDLGKPEHVGTWVRKEIEY